jgi:hypothetical protein
MARYNKIFAGPAQANLPQVHEALVNAGAGLLPGSVVVLSSGEWVYAGTSTVGKVWLLQDNYLAGGDVDDVIADNQTGIGMELIPGMLYYARVSTGNNLAKGDALIPGASGVLVKSTGNKKMVVAFADETYNNDTGSTQLVRVRAATGYLTPSSAA